MITIPLTQGQVAFVDEADYEDVSKFKWWAFRGGATFYACAFTKNLKKSSIIKMHRYILQPPFHLDVDHINGNGLDNRRKNLRTCTSSQNMANRRKTLGTCSSDYKGVYWYERKGKWGSSIKKWGKRFWLGYFINERDAAIAYDNASEKMFGDFSRPNFPHGNTSDAHSPQPRLSGSHRGAGLRFDSGSNFFVWQFPNRGFFPRRGITVEEFR